MIIGFTGTQNGMTSEQKREVEHILMAYYVVGKDNWVHHGDCVGADAQFNEIARSIYYVPKKHPASDVAEEKKAHCDCEAYQAKPALERNHDIVDLAEIMLACPKAHSEELRSGTWATIRYTKKVKKPLAIIYPDGAIERINWRLV
jgi:hypothetical protein